MSKAKPSYQSLKAELDSILAELQDENIDVDQTVQKYKAVVWSLINSSKPNCKTPRTPLPNCRPSFRTVNDLAIGGPSHCCYSVLGVFCCLVAPYCQP